MSHRAVTQVSPESSFYSYMQSKSILPSNSSYRDNVVKDKEKEVSFNSDNNSNFHANNMFTLTSNSGGNHTLIEPMVPSDNQNHMPSIDIINSISSTIPCSVPQTTDDFDEMIRILENQSEVFDRDDINISHDKDYNFFGSQMVADSLQQSNNEVNDHTTSAYDNAMVFGKDNLLNIPNADGLIHKNSASGGHGRTTRKRVSDSPRTCATCSRTFKYPSDLKKHEQTHTEVKKFACKFCNKPFRRLHQLNVHERIHTGAKPYACTKCNMSFRHDSTLAMHTRTRHDGLRPFTCDQCHKTFGRLSHLRKHETYVCKTDQKVLSRKKNKSTASEVPSFKCINCSLVFNKTNEFIDHRESCNASGNSQIHGQYIDHIANEEACSINNVCFYCGIEFNSYFECQKHIVDDHSMQMFGSKIDFREISSVHPIESYNDHNSTFQDTSQFTFHAISGSNTFFNSYGCDGTPLNFDMNTNFMIPEMEVESKKSADEIESLMEEKCDHTNKNSFDNSS